jgi:leucyl-tRNA synthetase
MLALKRPLRTLLSCAFTQQFFGQRQVTAGESLIMQEMKAAAPSLRTGALNEFDRGFQAEMDALAFERCATGMRWAELRMEFKTALKLGLYDYESARNWYRTVSAAENGGAGMHHDLVFKWIRNNALLISPFTPHFSEHVWQTVLGEASSVQTARFPEAKPANDVSTLQQLEYLRGVVDSIRSAEALVSRKKGGKAKADITPYDPSRPKCARIYVANDFPPWQKDCVRITREAWTKQDNSFDDVKLREKLAAAGLIKDKRVMPFCQSIKVRCLHPGVVRLMLKTTAQGHG